MSGFRKAVIPQQENYETDRLRQASDSTQRQLQADPMLGGKVIYDVALSAGTNTVEHGLGRLPKNSMMMHIRAPSALTSQIRISAVTRTTFTIVSPIGATVNLWVK